MAIVQLPLPIAANTGVTPNIKTMTTTDSLTTITAAGYLNSGNLQGYPVGPQDVLHIIYSYDLNTKVGTFGIFTVAVANGVITLSEDQTTNEVTYTPPSVANHIAVFSNTTGNLTDDVSIAINGGSIQAGLNGVLGKFILYSGTAGLGSSQITCSGNTNLAVATLNFESVPTGITYHLNTDVYTPNIYILTSTIPTTNSASIIAFSVSCTATLLGTAGTVILVASGGTERYRIYNLNISKNGTNFSGGGGDRLLSISDGTTSYSVVPAATLQSLTNSVWGVTALPFPATGGISDSTAAGATLVASYSGGTTDYTAGNIVISGLAVRIA